MEMSLEFDWRILFEVLIALFLGGLIGIEREIANRPAGFRTHALVCAAAAFLVGVGQILAAQQGAGKSDPLRIVEAIITGVSFLGAGTIFRAERSHVEGLTTAASLLMTAAIGISVALRKFALALAVTLIVLAVLFVFGQVEVRVKQAVKGRKDSA